MEKLLKNMADTHQDLLDPSMNLKQLLASKYNLYFEETLENSKIENFREQPEKLYNFLKEKQLLEQCQIEFTIYLADFFKFILVNSNFSKEAMELAKELRAKFGSEIDAGKREQKQEGSNAISKENFLFLRLAKGADPEDAELLYLNGELKKHKKLYPQLELETLPYTDRGDLAVLKKELAELEKEKRVLKLAQYNLRQKQALEIEKEKTHLEKFKEFIHKIIGRFYDR